MFERHVCFLSLENFLQPQLRYLGNKSSPLSLEMLREAYMVSAMHFKRARDRHPSKVTKEIPKFKVGDLVLLRKYKK